MIQDTAQLVSQFFLFGLLNKDQSLFLSQKALQKFRANELNEEQAIVVLGDCYKFLQEFLIGKVRPRLEMEEIAELIDLESSSADLRGWQEFLKKATVEEVGAIVACHILGFTEEQTCKAYKITQGTLKYRLSRGFRKLGRIVGGQTVKLVAQ